MNKKDTTNIGNTKNIIIAVLLILVVLLTIALSIVSVLLGKGYRGGFGDNNADGTPSTPDPEIPGVVYTNNVLGPGGGGGLFTPAINPSEDKNILVGCDMSNTLVSVNGGEKFVMKNLMGKAEYSFSPHNKNVVYAFNDYVYKSDDYGLNFEIVFPAASNIKGIISGVQAGGKFTLHDEKKKSERPIAALEVDPDDKNIIYFVTRGANNVKPKVYRTKNGGETWDVYAELPAGSLRKYDYDAKALESTAVVKMFIDPNSDKDKREIYFLGNDGLYKLNGDRSCLHIADRINFSGDIYYNSKTKQTSFYIVEKAVSDAEKFTTQISRSTDFGATWQSVSDTFLDHTRNDDDKYDYDAFKRTIVKVAVADENRIYASFKTKYPSGQGKPWSLTGLNYGVGTSGDGGKTWVCGLKAWDLESISAHSWLEYMYGKSGEVSLGWSGVELALAASKGNPDMAIVTGFGGGYITKDAGVSWQDLASDFDAETMLASSKGIDVTGCWDISIDPFDSKHMFFAYNDIGLFESKDAGKTWLKHGPDRGIPSQAAYSNACYGVEFDPDIEGFYVAAYAGTHDLNIGTYLKNIYKLADGPSKWYNYKGGVARTTNAGISWDVTGEPKKDVETSFRDDDGVSGLPDHALCTDITIDPLSPKDTDQRVVYVTCIGYGVYKSTDGGRTFKKFIKGTEGVRRQTVWRLKWNSDYSRLYVVYAPTESSWDSDTDNSFIDYCPGDGPVYYLERGSDTWQKIASMPGQAEGEELSENKRGLNYVSTFNGIAFDKDNNLYAAGRAGSVGGSDTLRDYGGAWVSKNNGATWKNIYPSNVNVYDIMVDSRDSNIIYICTTLGGEILVSYKGADTTAEDWIKFEKFEFSNPTRLFQDTVNKGYIYVGTHGGGTWHLKVPEKESE